MAPSRIKEPIPRGEFARRVCVKAHFASRPPCAHHVQMAERYYSLVTDAGTEALAVILEARAEAGRETDGVA